MGGAAKRCVLESVAAAACLLAAGPALAQLNLCVEVAPGKAAADAETLGRLVRLEIDRHPTHRSAAAGADCQSYLTIDVIDLGGQEGRWITGRINTQVPHREKIGPDGLAPAVERLLTVLLHNDPMVLRGPESPGWFSRQKRALEARSVTHFGAEAFELVARLGSSFDALPGLAFTLRREISALYVGARLAGAFNPSARRDELRLRAQFDAQVEAVLYSNPTGNTSLFGGGLVGLVYHRFEGPAPFDGPDARGSAATYGLSLGVRGGIETMRTSDVRLLAFIQLQAPAFMSEDPDHGVVDHWVPTVSIGAGAMF